MVDKTHESGNGNYLDIFDERCFSRIDSRDINRSYAVGTCDRHHGENSRSVAERTIEGEFAEKNGKAEVSSYLAGSGKNTDGYWEIVACSFFTHFSRCEIYRDAVIGKGSATVANSRAHTPFASWTAASGRPTISMRNKPGEISTSHSTTAPSRPISAQVSTRASATPPPSFWVKGMTSKTLLNTYGLP